jgi:hypothetical protein
MTEPTPTNQPDPNESPVRYRAHICVEFTTDSMFVDMMADRIARCIADHVGFPYPIDAVWLDDVTEPDPNLNGED